MNRTRYALTTTPAFQSSRRSGAGSSPRSDSFEYSNVTEATIEVPSKHFLSGPLPNPFSRSTQFTLTVANEQHVRVDPFNATGRHVRAIHDGVVAADTRQTFARALSCFDE